MLPSAIRLLLLSVLILSGCAQTTATRARWYTRNGQPADPVALRNARDRCRERVQVPTRSGPGDNAEWGLAMIECLHDEGFTRVTDDPELAR
jgi:hypothetical protein